MGRQRRRNKRIERAANNLQLQPGEMVQVPASVLQAVLASQAPQKKSSTVLTPGAPLQPYEGVTPKMGPRIWSYPLGFNLTNVDRTYGHRDVPSFQQLRNLANLYDGISLCERVWFDYVAKTHLKITPRQEVLEEGRTEKDFQKEISGYLKWFDKPDRINDQHSWLRMALREQLQLDALPIYFHPTRGGELYSIEIIDGSSIKPLLDDRGMQPQPPFPAYQQFLYNGIPAGWYTTEQMAYFKESPRADSVFGFSRVERVIMRVNQAIRKQKKDLARFTEGNVPAGFAQLPPSDQKWTADQITAYQELFDALMAGNDAARARIKFIPPGFEYQAIEEPDIYVEFDRFLLNACVASYGITMADLGFTESVNKSSGETQENVTYRRAMAALMAMYAMLFTRVITDWFHDDRFEVSFSGFEEAEDLEMLAGAYSTLTGAGILGLSNAGKLLKLPEEPGAPYIGRIIITKSGPIFLDDMAQPEMRQAQQQAQMAGFQLAANPQPQQDEQENDDEEEPEQKASDKGASAQGKKGPQDKQKVERDQTYSGNNAGMVGYKLAGSSKNDNRPKVLEEHTGMMVAFMLDSDTARLLAVPGGEPPENMHVTLAFLGDMNDEPKEGKLHPAKQMIPLVQALKSYAQESSIPLVGKVGGIGRFAPSEHSDDTSPIIALVNVLGLQQWRSGLVERIETAGYKVANDFDYTPHITLVYIPADAPIPVDSVPPVVLAFDTICLALGDDRYYFRFGSEQVTEPEMIAAQAIDPTASDQIPALRAEYRRWRGRAIEDVKQRRVLRGFTTTLIPEATHAHIEAQLQRCRTVDEVKQVFSLAKEQEEVKV